MPLRIAQPNYRGLFVASRVGRGVKSVLLAFRDYLMAGDIGFVLAGRSIDNRNCLPTMLTRVENKSDKPKVMARDLFMQLNVRGESGTAIVNDCCHLLLVSTRQDLKVAECVQFGGGAACSQYYIHCSPIRIQEMQSLRIDDRKKCLPHVTQMNTTSVAADI